MTIKEFYEVAKFMKCENTKLTITYNCSDNYYSFNKMEIKDENIVFQNGEINIEIDEN